MYKRNNILCLILVGFSLSNVISSYSIGAGNSDSEYVANNSTLQDTPYSEDPMCINFTVPNTIYASKCCGKRYFKSSDRKTRSVGSKKASSAEYPWVVLLEYPTDFLCTGFLISNKYVLTAAHCVNMLIEPKSVRLGHRGETDKVVCTNNGTRRTCNDGAISVPIEKILTHPKYSITDTWNNNIAIIKLKEIVHFSEYIQPICLPASEVTGKLAPDVRYEFAGWSETYQTIYNNLTKTFNLPQKTGKKITKVENMTYTSNDECQKAYNTSNTSNTLKTFKLKFTINDTNICAGGVTGQGPCPGGTGGPLMYKNDDRYVAVGVLGPCLPALGVPAVFTNIFKYDLWIRLNTNEISDEFEKPVYSNSWNPVIKVPTFVFEEKKRSGSSTAWIIIVVILKIIFAGLYISMRCFRDSSTSGA